MITFNGTGWIIQNLIVDCANLASTIGIVLLSLSVIRQCVVKRFTNKAIVAAAVPLTIIQCEICCGSGVRAVDGALCLYNYVHDNTCVGIGINNSSGVCIGNLIVNNTGATSDGITTTTDNNVISNTIYGNGRHGIHDPYDTGPRVVRLLADNLLVGNGGYGIVAGTGAGWPAFVLNDGNAYYGNAGTRQNMNDVGSTNPINGVAPYVSALDVILGASPFVHASLTLSDLSVNASNNLRVHSSTYTFVAGDVGSTIFIVNTTSGWTAAAQFTIASLSGGDAILTASPGATSSTGGIWHFDNYNLNTALTGGPTSWPGNTLTVSATSIGAIQPASAGVIINVES